jgi:hypothetical protein
VIVRTRIEGSRLVGNLLGDPSERELVVYLPPGYDDSERRYPTAYLLHALGSSPEEMVTPEADGQRWRPPIEDVLDPVFGRDEAALWEYLIKQTDEISGRYGQATELRVIARAG